MAMGHRNVSYFPGQDNNLAEKGQEHWRRLTVGVDQTSLKGLGQHALSHLSCFFMLLINDFIHLNESALESC